MTIIGLLCLVIIAQTNGAKAAGENFDQFCSDLKGLMEKHGVEIVVQPADKRDNSDVIIEQDSKDAGDNGFMFAVEDGESDEDRSEDGKSDFPIDDSEMIAEDGERDLNPVGYDENNFDKNKQSQDGQDSANEDVDLMDVASEEVSKDVEDNTTESLNDSLNPFPANAQKYFNGNTEEDGIVIVGDNPLERMKDSRENSESPLGEISFSFADKDASEAGRDIGNRPASDSVQPSDLFVDGDGNIEEITGDKSENDDKAPVYDVTKDAIVRELYDIIHTMYLNNEN